MPRSRDWPLTRFLIWRCLACFIISDIICCGASRPQRPAAAYAPLFTGTIKFADVPDYASPTAPPVLAPVGRRRRLNNFPPALELSSAVIERVSNTDANTPGGRRRLQNIDSVHQQQQQQEQETQQLLGLAGQVQHDHNQQQLQQQHNQQQQQQQPQTDPPSQQTGTSAAPTTRRLQRHRRRQQRQPGLRQQSDKQRPGWTGLWWADAGGVGVAAGPRHVLHAVSAVLAVYIIDQASGNQVGSKVVALQDLFAPVGAENCKDGVYDAVPVYDKAAGRFLISATCSGKGAALLAVSATGDPTGSWFLFTLLADGDGTGMACSSPKESAVADSVRLTYDNNGVYLSLFNYCPSAPAVKGATILALPKHKVLKGAPNFVYAVFSADQVLAALEPGYKDDLNLSPGSYRQCQPAPPQTATDAASNAAYFVCDHIGPDSQPRTSFTLVSIINTGALWQFAGTHAASPTCFLTANIIQRGIDAPMSAKVMLPQPEAGSLLHAGGTTPAGFWSGSAVFAGGKVYTVDRIDVTDTSRPPLAPVTMPSLMWTEVAVTTSMAGAGDCARTESWGSKWDWSKDWSVDWGKDFDLEWEEHREEAALLQQQVAMIEEAARKARLEAAACAAAAVNTTANETSSLDGALQEEQRQVAEQSGISDGSAATVDGAPMPAANLTMSVNCSALTVANGSISSDPSRPNSATTDESGAPAQDGHHRRLSAVSPAAGHFGGKTAVSSSITAAVQAAAKATGGSTSTKHLIAWRGMPDPVGRIADDPNLQQLNSAQLSFQQVYYGAAAYEGWKLGCWYCTSSGGLYYSSSWFYRYWYDNWDFGWYRQYKRNYAPGWSKPFKGLGRHHFRRRSILQDGSGSTPLAENPAGMILNGTNPGNDSIVIPPCLLTGQSYKNTCKQCNYTTFSVNVTVNVTRSGVISKLGPNPIGFVAPSIAVAPGGSIVIVSGYSGPGAHPNSSMLAYPGIAVMTVAPNSTEASWKVLRTGIGKVRSTSGRWTDYSSIDIGTVGTAKTAAKGDTTMHDVAAGWRLYYGVQWSQRAVECDAADDSADAAYEPVCAMPAPWIGYMAAA